MMEAARLLAIFIAAGIVALGLARLPDRADRDATARHASTRGGRFIGAGRATNGTAPR
jgi:hypothetical protein